MSDAELRLALAFAKLEIIEVQAGKRTLTQCPGVESVAKAIAEAKAELERGA